jgi:hypothetical protein
VRADPARHGVGLGDAPVELVVVAEELDARTRHRADACPRFFIADPFDEDGRLLCLSALSHCCPIL